MFESGVLSRGHRPSCFWVGTLFPKKPVCFHVNIRTRSFVRLSICTMAHSQSAGGRDNKNKRSRYFILSFIQLIFYLFFLSWVNAQSFASSSLLWSAEKLQWILFGSVWLFVYEVHLYMWLTSTPAASLSVSYGQVLHYRCITLQAYWFFFISKYFDNLLNRWGKCFASLKKEV